MSIYDHPVTTLGGGAADLHDYADTAVLVVNVASRCGLTPQYAGLERLQERFADRGFAVLGFPCNQFRGQEPGTAQEIQEFCSASGDITWNFEKFVIAPGGTSVTRFGPRTEPEADEVVAAIVSALPGGS